MDALSAAGILAVWDAGASQHPLDRALTLLAAVSPGSSRAALAALSIGERDRRLLELRERTFGSSFECVATCPGCDETIEFEFRAEAARAPRVASDTLAIALEADGWAWSVRLPDSRDLAALVPAADRDAARSALVERCVMNARHDGSNIPPAALPGAVVDLLSVRLAESAPPAVVAPEVQCPTCGQSWEPVFDIADFFWTELRVAARRLLHDVDALARTYGWSEAEILALSPGRRAAYLELIGT